MYERLTMMACTANDCNKQGEVLCDAAVINIHGMEDTKTTAVNSLVTT